MGVELRGERADVIRERVGVDVFDDNKGVDSILLFSDNGPCILLL